jgi:2-methylcitrate dehydratase PrpD
MQEVTRTLSDFVCRTRLEDIPRDVIDVARLHILDALGTLIAGSAEAAAGIVRDHIRSLGCKEESTLITQGLKTSPQYAAFGNGIIAHVLDFDDYEVPSMAHPSVTVLPAVLALGERGRADGRECLAAYLVGMETISKIGAGVAPEHYDKGWHSTGTLGSLGSAAAASKLLKLDPGKTRTAIGIAASMSSGMRGNFGTMTKAFHAGHASRNGVEAALLASSGFTASQDILESDLGFCKLFADKDRARLEESIQDFGLPFSILSPGVGKKPYPSCAATHSFIEGIFQLIDQYDIRAEDVDSVQCGVSYRVPTMLIHSDPQTGLEGKFSLEFCIALALQERTVGLSQFTDSKVKAPEIRRLIKRIQKAVTEEAGGRGAPQAALITVRMKNGKSHFCKVVTRKGTPANPLTSEEVSDKFMGCAELNYSREQSGRILDAVMNIEKMDPIGKLIDLMK